MPPKSDIAFVLDWDGVIFNRAAWSKEMFRAGAKLGYPMAAILAAYPLARTKEGYSPRRHAEILALGRKVKAKKLERAFWSAMPKAPDYIFLAARKALAALRARQITLYILSAGNQKFQRSKIEASGLAGYFQKIYIVAGGIGLPGSNKAKILRRIVRAHFRVVFVDDWIENIFVASRDPALKKRVLAVLVGREPLVPRGARQIERFSISEIRRSIPEAGL